MSASELLQDIDTKQATTSQFLQKEDAELIKEGKYEPPRDNPHYHPTQATLGGSRLPMYDVPDYKTPKAPLTLDKNMPDFVIKLDRFNPRVADMNRLRDWLEGNGNHIGKMLCLPESKYCLILTYEKLVGNTYSKVKSIQRLTPPLVNEIDRLANQRTLIQALYKSADGGKLTKIRITWLD